MPITMDIDRKSKKGVPHIPLAIFDSLLEAGDMKQEPGRHLRRPGLILLAILLLDSDDLYGAWSMWLPTKAESLLTFGQKRGFRQPFS